MKLPSFTLAVVSPGIHLWRWKKPGGSLSPVPPLTTSSVINLITGSVHSSDFPVLPQRAGYWNVTQAIACNRSYRVFGFLLGRYKTPLLVLMMFLVFCTHLSEPVLPGTQSQCLGKCFFFLWFLRSTVPWMAVAELARGGCWPGRVSSNAVNTSRSDPRAIGIAAIQPRKNSSNLKTY